MIRGLSFNDLSMGLNEGANHPLRGDDLSLMISIATSATSGEVLERIRAGTASEGDLISVHTPLYLKEVKRRSDLSIALTPETPLSPDLILSHMAIVGGVLAAVRRLKDAGGGVYLAPGGFHHAGPDYGGGFCVFNDVALATKLAQSLGWEKVMIVDTDAHAGNGTMDIFYDDPSVLFVSIHQDPKTLFPGKGFLDETGSGP